ncbi:protein YIPF2 isoform X1 [Brachionichthys hirsutus]|uniref:protein YIPF2 isoform X1 n=1 Tax=Brachionichthys hirsutus TaxID=412623 RepID=UPI003604F714
MASPGDLQFQAFEEAAELLSAEPGASTPGVSTSSTSSTAVELDVSEEEEGHQESSELLAGPKATGGFWTFEYYQSFFNVDTMQVLDRVKGSMMPLPGRNFIKHHLKRNPDLYGPFWICVTLVFTLAISGNLCTFLSEMGNPTYRYTPQFHRVSVAAAMVFTYAWLVPGALWGFLVWRQGSERQIRSVSFLETVCVYGYSLFIYIPTSVLWLFPFEWLHWTLILVAILVSGSVLVLTFWPTVSGDNKAMAVAAAAAIVLLHTLLPVGCKLYFFKTAEPSYSPANMTTHP